MAKLKRMRTKMFTCHMNRALGVDITPMLNEPAMNVFISQKIKGNVDLIKTIPPKYHASLTKNIQRFTTDKPFDQQAIRQMLSRPYKLSGYNLRRLTRDQTSKTIAQFKEMCQKDIGITHYSGRSSETRTFVDRIR